MLKIKRMGSVGLLLALLIGLSGCEATEAAERVALVVGNSEYTHAPSLSNPERDAAAIAKALKGLGFAVTGPLLNQNKAQMDAALKAFGRRSQGATAAVLYFGGHGVEVGGRNYLLPTDVTLERERDVALEGVSLEVVVDQLGGASGYRLVILDACRDNPLAAQMQRTDGTRSTYRGLAPIEVSGQTYVAYAARAGQKAKDGTAGDHSPYAAALLKYLKEPLPLPNLFGAVREEVRQATSGEQEPWLYGAFGREPIYLVGEAPVAEPTPVAAPTPAPVAAPVAPLPTVDHDLIAWQSAEKCGTAACFRAYLKKHPQGQYAEMARARLEPEAVPESRPVVATTPTARPAAKQRFTDDDNGTVTDNQTGLIWLKDANCFGSKNWSTAMDLAKRLKHGQCGLRDGSVAGQWRLPSKEEWEALIDKDARDPPLSAEHPFTSVQPSSYWSSTAVVRWIGKASGGAWIRYLNGDGLESSIDKDNINYVWPVRSGR